MNETKIGFIGAGNMGQSLIKGLLRQNFEPRSIWVVDHHQDKLSQLQRDYQVNTSHEASDIIEAIDVIILAIKPQDIKALLNRIKPAIKINSKLIISVAAGIQSNQIGNWLENGNIPLIRAMPNTPALFNMGITGLYATKAVSSSQQALADKLFKAVGETVWVENESLIDAITALSGSGPAYFFYMLESLIESGIELGLSESQATKLAHHTGLGALEMARQSNQPLEALRNAVTSKGGTTEAGLKALMNNDFKNTLKAALKAAYLRSKALSQSNS